MAKSCLCCSTSSRIKTAFGGSAAKLSGPILQLPIKWVVSTDDTILSGLSENIIVLSDTLLNSSVEVVAFTSDTEPDCAPWINKNLTSVIFLDIVALSPAICAPTEPITLNPVTDRVAIALRMAKIPMPSLFNSGLVPAGRIKRYWITLSRQTYTNRSVPFSSKKSEKRLLISCCIIWVYHLKIVYHCFSYKTNFTDIDRASERFKSLYHEVSEEVSRASEEGHLLLVSVWPSLQPAI